MSVGHGAAQLQGAPFMDCFNPGLAQCTGRTAVHCALGQRFRGTQSGTEKTQLLLQGGG